MFVPVKWIAIFIAGAILSIVGGVIYGVFPSIMENKVKETFQIREGSYAYDVWEELPLPLSMKFYFFNVTNVDDILNNNSKPILKERGPYTYNEIRKKVDIAWNDEDKTVSYRQVKTYYFAKDKSVGDVDDLITIPNIPLISIVSLAENYSETLQGLLAMQGVKEQPYVTKKVSELLFDGYFDPFVKQAQDVANQHVIVNNTFGIFVGQNNTDDGEYTVYTGVDDPAKFTKIVSWKNLTELNYWKINSTCNDILGTDGSQYPPYISKEDTLYILVSELCRSVFVKYDSEVENEGITNYRFKTTSDLFADPLLNQDNACYCSTDDCHETGVLSISTCKFGAPITVSLPHFYQAEPALLETVDGLKPDPDKHSIFLDVEPTTGVPMNAARRVQLNVDIKLPKSEKLRFLQIPNIMHPVLWLDEGATIDEANADTFKSLVLTPVKIVKGVTWSLIIIGILMAIVSVVVAFKKGCPKHNEIEEISLK